MRLAVTFPVLGMRGGFYWQVWPHRVIFPMLLFLYGAWILKKELVAMGGQQWIGYLICLASNTLEYRDGAASDSGMGRTAYVSRTLSDKKFSIKIRRLFLVELQHNIAGMAGSLLGAYGFVNLYNILKHSPVNSFEDFLIPLAFR